MDIERIIHSDIPDVAQVYGGVRGRAMTEKHMGRDFLRMSQCLNAFFRKSIEKNGVEPIPHNVFNKRKAQIKKAWKKQEETESQE